MTARAPERRPAQRPSPQSAPPLTPRESLRFFWTQITSMRTALILLFALAVAAR